MSPSLGSILHFGIFALSLSLAAVMLIIAVISMINKNIIGSAVAVGLVVVILWLQTLSDYISTLVGR